MSHDSLPKAILTEHLADEAAQYLAQHTNLIRHTHTDYTGLLEHLRDTEALIVRTYTIVDEPLLTAAPNLKVIARAGVGLDNIDLLAAQKHNIPVVHTPDANTQAVVEYVFGLILDHYRPRLRFNTHIPIETFHHHRKTQVGRQLNELTLAILGMGRIGRRIAQVAHAVGIKTIFHDLLSDEQLNFTSTNLAARLPLDDLLAAADILTIHVDGRPENKNLIDEPFLEYLNPSATLINTSRGFIVDAPALAAWATRNQPHNAHVILDVHHPEPPPKDYPLFNLPNVDLLPHLASRTNTALLNMSWVVKDVVRILNGHPPEFPAY